jgi:hypothetical protein
MRRLLERSWAFCRVPEHAIFLVTTLAFIAPIWWFAILPSQDGPQHLDIASIFAHYGDADAGVLRAVYVRSFEVTPYWIGYAILAGLQTFLPPLLVEKLFLTLYTGLFAVALRVLGRRLAMSLEGSGEAGRQGSFIATFGLVLVHSYLFHMGFWNFCLALPMGFFVLAAWLRLVEAPAERMNRAAALFGVLCLVLYFCHLAVTVMMLMAIGLLGVGHALRELGARRIRPLVAVTWRTLLAIAPTVALGLGYMHDKGGSKGGPLPGKLLGQRLLAGDCLVSFSSDVRPARLVVLGLVVLLAAVLGRRLWQRKLARWDALGLVLAGWTLLYFLGPEKAANGGMISVRTNLFVYIAVLLLAAATAWPRWARLGLQIGGALLALGLWVSHVRVYARIEPDLVELAETGEHLPRGITFLPLMASQKGRDPGAITGRIRALAGAQGRVAASRRAASLQQFVANTDFSPVRYRPRVNPFQLIARQPGGIGNDPPSVDFADYALRSGVQLDAVLVWNIAPQQEKRPTVQRIRRQLAAGFDLAYTSPTGRGQIWLARPRPKEP